MPSPVNLPQQDQLLNCSKEERALQSRSTRPRLLQLDALRGLAAVSVVLCHTRNAVREEPPSLKIAPFVAGTPAVVLFFILSGYVLCLPYWNGSQLPYGVYLRRRLCRIYLPFAAAAALSVLAAHFFQGFHLDLTPWFRLTWRDPITAKLVAQQFLMVPMAIFNTAFWSLTYEMQMSIVMPLMCALMLRVRPAVFTCLWAFGLYLVPDKTFLTMSTYLNNTVQIIFLFALGATLAYYSDALRDLSSRLGSRMWAILVFACFLYFDYPALMSRHHGRLFHQISSREYLFAGVGASVIILSSLYMEPVARFLKHSLPEYLGRISYSLYLTHSIVLFAVFDLLYQRLPTRCVIATVLVGAAAFAHVFCLYVEEPFMRLGKRIGAKRVNPVAS